MSSVTLANCFSKQEHASEQIRVNDCRSVEQEERRQAVDCSIAEDTVDTKADNDSSVGREILEPESGIFSQIFFLLFLFVSPKKFGRMDSAPSSKLGSSNLLR